MTASTTVGRALDSTCRERTYKNAGNRPLLDLLPRAATVVLDVGCGAGDNARLLRQQVGVRRIDGITLSEAERQEALPYLERCVVADVQHGVPAELRDTRYDVVLFSHVLEHLPSPAETVAAFAALLAPGGHMLIAVPNVLTWRQRARFLLGRFEYEEAGTMDSTHLRFFSYDSADTYLLQAASRLRVVVKRASGSVPMWILRRHLLPRRLSQAIDRLGSRLWPNLFGEQVLMLLQKT